MKVSRNWLQNYFEAPLPDVNELATALTFHVFEIESIGKPDNSNAWDILDVKITPNRGHDCLSHRGIAKELSAILNLPLTKERDPFAKKPDLTKKTDAVTVSIEDPKLCPRYIAGYIRGVKVGPSPEWLRTSLESVGQKSINAVVDATNLVMFNTGQPMHAFDAKKLGSLAIGVRRAREREQMHALDGKVYPLTSSMLVITAADRAVGIAGVKGGQETGIDETTTDIVLEAANFDGPTTRRTAAALKLRTDASERFQQVLSPELAAYGMQQAVELIAKLSGGKVEGFVDEYPVPQKQGTVSVSREKINAVLGTKLAEADVAEAFTRLGLPFERKGADFVVTPPFERLDLVIPEDLVEEVARIVGYERIPATPLPAPKRTPEVNPMFSAAEKSREELLSKGYSEVFTSVFADKGEVEVLNKVGGERPYLRSTLTDGLRDAYERNFRNKDLLGLGEVRLFEIGAVWKSGKETVMVGTVDSSGAQEKLLQPHAASAYDDLPLSSAVRYEAFSKYPYVVRDIALWVPSGTNADDILTVIRKAAGQLLVRSEKFDEFKKGDKTSYAFRLVFQSFDRTLTDEDANQRMESVYAAVKAKGWEVR